MKCETLFILIISVRQHSTQFELTWCNANHLSFVTLKSSSKFNWRQKIRTIFFRFFVFARLVFCSVFHIENRCYHLNVCISVYFVISFVLSHSTISCFIKWIETKSKSRALTAFYFKFVCTLTTNFFFFFLIYFFRSLFLLILFVFCCCRRWNFEPWNHFALYAWR